MSFVKDVKNDKSFILKTFFVNHPTSSYFSTTPFPKAIFWPAGYSMGIASTDVVRYSPRRFRAKKATVMTNKTTTSATQTSMTIMIVFGLDSVCLSAKKGTGG